MTITCIIKTLLLIFLIFVLLSYTIFLYEKSNRDNRQIKQMVSLGGLWLTLRILVQEYIFLLITVILWPIGFFNQKDGAEPAQEQTPTLFLHGLFLNQACWLAMKLRLKMQGFTNLHSINLPPTRDVETLTERVALKVDSLRHSCKCERVHLVGHSMGGIIARNFVQIRGGADKVDQCVLLGSPHQGSKLAPFAVMKLSEAIMPGSEFLANLNKQPLPGKVAVTNIYSRHDNLVIPHESAILDQATNIELAGKGHNTLLYDNSVFNHIRSILKTDNADDKDQQQQTS